MKNQQIKNKLLNLGFSEHDALVYLALIIKGSGTAGPLVAYTNLHRNIVYTSIDHLISRKLATSKIINSRKNFSVTSPEIIIEEFSHKLSAAKKLVKQIQSTIPKNLQEITIHQGNIEYLDLLTSIINTMPSGSTKYVLGTGGKKFMKNTMLPIWNKYHKMAIQKNIKIKMISYESQRNEINFDNHLKKIYQIKFLPDNIENPSGMHIYPVANTTLNIIYSDDKFPVTAIKIINEALVKGNLHLFNNLWKMASST